MSFKEFWLAALMIATPSQAAVYLSQQEALRLAFPKDARVERKTAYLSEKDVRKAEALGSVKIESRVWTYYVGKSSTGALGFAYFETHAVRTMPETFMAVLDARGGLRFVELLAFHEPEDYKPAGRWLRQFDGKSLKDRLFVRRSIRNMTGASLTSAALTDGVRRILAVHAVLQPARKENEKQ